MKRSRPKSGEARTVLVFGQKAILTVVEAEATDMDPAGTTAPGDFLKSVGPVQFAPETLDHIRSVVLGIANSILNMLGKPICSFRLSLRNVGANSVQGLGTRIQGLSADLAILIAMLSAALGITVSPTMLFTGPIASMEGQIADAASLDIKIGATRADPSVKILVCPPLDADGSLAALVPDEYERAMRAILASEGRPRIITVGDVAELLYHAFSPDKIVLSSLRKGFYGAPPVEDDPSTPVGRAVRHLVNDNPKSFWHVLGEHLLDCQTGQSRELLEEFANYHLNKGTYPSGLGRRLHNLVQSLPPVVRHAQARLPLLPARICFKLGLLASGADERDAVTLLDATHGPYVGRQAASQRTKKPKDQKNRWHRTVEYVLESISADSLAHQYMIPLDAARASFVPATMVCRSHDEFMDLLGAFYRHMAQCSGLLSLPANDVQAEAEAIQLLKEAFGDPGGDKAAEAEARSGLHGGNRLVLDQLTTRLQDRLKYMHVDRLLKEAVDPLRPRQKEQFVRALVDHLGDLLPDDIRRRLPRDFAEHRDLLVKVITQSRDKIAEAFRGI